MSNERINSINTPNHSTTSNLNYYVTKTRVEFNGSCFKQHKTTSIYGKVVNIYIFYEISKSLNISDFQHKNDDIDKYKYSGYGIGFDRHGSFSFPRTGMRRNVIYFWIRYEFINKYW